MHSFFAADSTAMYAKFQEHAPANNPITRYICHAACHSILANTLALQAFDGGLQHKWLDFGGANKGVTWLEYRLLPSQAAVAVTRYSLTSADDEPNRDPCDFVLEGSVELPMASGTSMYLRRIACAGLVPCYELILSCGRAMQCNDCCPVIGQPILRGQVHLEGC